MSNRFFCGKTGEFGAGNPNSVLLSLGIHLGILAILILAPLIYTEALPLGQIRNYFISAPLQPPPRSLRSVKIISAEHRASQIHTGHLQLLPEIPLVVSRIVDEGPPQSRDNASPWAVEGGMPGSQPYGILGGLTAFGSTAAQPPPQIKIPITPPSPIPIGGDVQQAKLIYGPTPIYPDLAKKMHTQGTVTLEAIISKEGRVKDLRVLSGHPLLIQAAVEAVKRWRYQPTLLSGQPVEVIATVTVNFKLSDK